MLMEPDGKLEKKCIIRCSLLHSNHSLQYILGSKNPLQIIPFPLSQPSSHNPTLTTPIPLSQPQPHSHNVLLFQKSLPTFAPKRSLKKRNTKSLHAQYTYNRIRMLKMIQARLAKVYLTNGRWHPWLDEWTVSCVETSVTYQQGSSVA